MLERSSVCNLKLLRLKTGVLLERVKVRQVLKSSKSNKNDEVLQADDKIIKAEPAWMVNAARGTRGAPPRERESSHHGRGLQGKQCLWRTESSFSEGGEGNTQRRGRGKGFC